MDLRTATSQFILALEATNEYQRLSASANIIKSNPLQQQQLDQFNQLQKKLQSSNISEHEAHSIIQELDNRYSMLSKTQEFSNYFNAHENFGRLMSAVIDDIRTSLLL